MIDKEKTEKRKALQAEIQSLNTQMMQRKIEIQKEKREAEAAASTTMKQVDVTQTVKTKIEGTNKVLESEIAIDQSRGVDTSKKEAEVGKNKERIQNIAETLKKVNT